MPKNLQSLLEEIQTEIRYTRSLIGKSTLDPRVMDAIGSVPRDKFVPPDLRVRAYDNRPLPIGHGQTISQPYIVALMTDLLQLKQDHRVLEIGTGSGYQTAILSQLCKQVYTVEVVRELGEAAATRLKRLGYGNIEFRIGNGYEGWPEHAPYDGIMVTAAAASIPDALAAQLKAGGKLVMPVGMPYSQQELMLVEKDAQGGLRTTDFLSVVFVPLVRDNSGQ